MIMNQMNIYYLDRIDLEAQKAPNMMSLHPVLLAFVKILLFVLRFHYLSFDFDFSRINSNSYVNPNHMGGGGAR